MAWISLMRNYESWHRKLDCRFCVLSTQRGMDELATLYSYVTISRSQYNKHLLADTASKRLLSGMDVLMALHILGVLEHLSAFATLVLPKLLCTIVQELTHKKRFYI